MLYSGQGLKSKTYTQKESQEFQAYQTIYNELFPEIKKKKDIQGKTFLILMRMQILRDNE